MELVAIWLLPNWMGNMQTWSCTGLRADMLSIGSRSGGLRSVTQRPGLLLPLLDNHMCSSHHCDTVNGRRGCSARASTALMRTAALTGAPLAAGRRSG